MAPPPTRYVLREKIGVGGMAEAWLADTVQPDGTARAVVVKKMLPNLASDPEYQSMFIDEARTAAALRHPNVVQMLDVGRMDGIPFIALEYVPGADLRILLRAAEAAGRPLSVAAALWAVREVLEALEYVHTRTGPDGAPLRLVHRDVGLSNVLVSRFGEVKLSDFGIAKSALSISKTAVGVIKGNLLSVAPEQIEGEPVTLQTDIYAVGLMLHAVLIGHHPLDGLSVAKAIDIHARGKLPSLSDSDPNADHELEGIVRRATERVPALRFPSAGSFAEALLAFAHHKRIELGPGALAAELEAIYDSARPTVGIASTPEHPSSSFRIAVSALVAGKSNSDLVATTSGLVPGQPDTPAAPEPPGLPPAAASEVSPPGAASPVFASAPRPPPPPPAGAPPPPPPAGAPPPPPTPPGQSPFAVASRFPEGRPPPPARFAPAPPPAELFAPPPRPVVVDLPVATALPIGATDDAPLTTEVTAPTGVPVSTAVDSLLAAVTTPNIQQLSPETTSSIPPITEEVPSPDVTSRSTAAVPAAPTMPEVTAPAVAVRDTIGAIPAQTTTPEITEVNAPALVAAAPASGSPQSIPAAVPPPELTTSSSPLPAPPPPAALVLRATWLGVLRGHKQSANAIAAWRNGLASGGSDGAVIVWDLEGRKPSRTYRGHSGVVTCLAAGEDGALLLSGSRDGTLRLWRNGTVSSSLTMKAHGRVSAVSIQEEGRLAVSAGDDRTLKVWDLVNSAPERTLTDAHQDFISAVEFVPGSSFVLSGSYDRTLKLWDARSGALLRTMTGSERVRSIDVDTEGGNALVGTADGWLTLWDLSTGELVETLTGHNTSVSAIRFVGKRIAFSGGFDGVVRAWDLEARQEIASITTPEAEPILALGVSNGRLFASRGDDLAMWVIEGLPV